MLIAYRFLEIGTQHDFVIHAMLAFSSLHLAWLTNSPGMKVLTYDHRGFALKGLSEAVARFQVDNSDAILATSLLLLWQATERLVKSVLISSNLLNILG